ncbi:MAG: copper chaperone PCu(A)C [Salinarimonas sp.]
MTTILNRAARAAALALALAAAPALPAFAADTFEAGDIRVETPWSRATPGAAPVAGGYLTIVNTGSEPDRLVGGSAEIAERFEVHSMETVDGVARMAPVEGGLEIPPGASVALAPGGYHVMFMGLRRPLAEGESFEGTLVFERAGEVPVTFAVGALGSRMPPMGHGAH